MRNLFRVQRPDQVRTLGPDFSVTHIMNTPLTLTSMFESIGLTYGPTLPFIVLVLFGLLMLPAVFRPSMRAESIGFAAYCYLAEMLGVLLMTSGGLPALHAVFSQEPVSETTYLGLLLMFAVGGAVLLWHDAQLRRVDEASKTIPGTLFFMTWKFIGLLVSVVSVLSIALKIVLNNAQATEDSWTMHIIMLAYGLILCWFTRSHRRSTPAFTSISTRTTSSIMPMPSARKPVKPTVASKPAKSPVSAKKRKR